MKVAVLAAAAALLASGCGKAKPATSIADVAPIDTVAVMTVSADDAYDVLRFLPAGPEVGAKLHRASFLTGGEFVVLLDEAGDRAVSMAPPGSAQKGLERSLRRNGFPYARVRGWTVWSRQKALVELVYRAKRRLADAGWYHPAEGSITYVSRRLTLRATHDAAEETVRSGHERTHELASLIPKDALGAAVFDSVPKLPFAAQLERGLGVRFADLAALAPHGGVVFMRAGQPVPTVTVLAPGGTLAAARRVVTELDPSAPPAQPAELDGVHLQVAHFGARDLYYGRFDGTLVVTDDPELKLHDVSALEPDGLPEQTAGWLYLAPEQGLPALESLATLAGTRISNRFADRVFPYRSVLAYWAGGKLTVRVR